MGAFSAVLHFILRATRQAYDHRHPDAMKQTLEYHDEIVAAASSCPEQNCGSLVLDYGPADNRRLGHPEDWGFTCSRCGLDFTVPLDELIFRSVPKQWFSGDTNVG